VDKIFLLNASQNLIGANLSNATPIQHIHIDNPSGSWLQINPSLKFVPPYTNGYELDLPGVTSLDVKWVDSPSGSVSNPVLPLGARVLVQLSDNPIGDSPGDTSGAGYQVAEVPLFAQARDVITVTEAGVAGALFVNNQPREKLIVTAVQLIAFGGVGDTKRVRAQVLGNIGWGGAPPPNIIAYLAISAASPSNIPIIDPQAAQLPAGEDINYSLAVVRGGGKSDVVLAATYYRVVT
jgi:hypothetical protein